MFLVRLPDWMTWYQRPEFRDIREYAKTIGTGSRFQFPEGRSKNAVPPNMRLERVLDNKTCSPMSLYDFYMYLKYIEYSPENLEFYIWYKNYEQKFSRSRPSSTKASISPSNASMTDLSATQMSSSRSDSDGTVCEDEETDANYSVDPEVANVTLEQIADLIGRQAMCGPGSCQPTLATRLKTAIRGIIPSNLENDAANAPAGTLNIITPRSARSELNAVINMFLLPNSEKELNIPPAMRDEALALLQHSTDPVHLTKIVDHVYLLLRNCSHRNFVRLGLGNGSFETLCSSILLGITSTTCGFLLLFLRAFVPHMATHSMFETFAAWPMWCIGMAFMLAGLRGNCFFLLMFARRQKLPWERFDDSASITSNKSSFMKRIGQHMLFDRKLRIKDAEMRKVQHRIIIQSLFGGSIFASLCVLIFIFLPIWKQTVHN